MANRVGRIRPAVLALCLLMPLLASCRSVRGEEQEQGALVAAVGIDPDPAGVRLTFEVLVPREGIGAEVRVLSAAGANAQEAYAALTADFPRGCLFGHCAVLVIGDGIPADVVAGMLSDEALPPEMQAVTAPQALALLSLGGSSTPAVGYDLQAILARHSGLRCRIYELMAGGKDEISQDRLPRFVPAPEGSGRLVDLQFRDDVSQESAEKGD